MKRILALCIAILVFAIIAAQPPNKMSYQAVIRNSNNQLVANTVIRIRISILQGSTAGNELYVETHSHTTNANGLLTIEIGGGTIISGNLNNINWAEGPYYLKTEIDPTGGTNYTITGTSQLLSVPYALYAEKANSVENINIDDADADPENELQTLEFTGRTLNISGGNSVLIPDEVKDNDSDSINELQVLSISNDTIYLTSGGFIVLPKEFKLRNLSIINSSNVENMELFTLDEAGYIKIKGSNTSTNIALAPNIFNSNQGYISVNDQNSDVKADLFVDAINNIGGLRVYGSNGYTNFVVSSLSGYPNNGFISVQNVAGVDKVRMGVDELGFGRVEADLKNFKIEHPTQPGKEIVYASIEGPEAAAYERGTGSLIDGETFIEYSEHFCIVASESDVTIMVTPLSANSKGLAVVEKKSNGFKIKELLNGTGNYEFDWEVKAKRKGFENYEVVRDKVNLENNFSSLPAK